MNYKELLSKYIEYIKECEGINFITDLPRTPPFVGTVFTEDEWAELEKLTNGI